MSKKNILNKRIECIFNIQSNNFIINKIINNFVFYEINFNLKFIFNKIYTYNIYYNFLIFNYKSFRWFFNLPLKGQKTRNNAKNSKKLNKILNDYNFFLYKKFYNVNDLILLKSLIFVEFINLLWKLNWTTEWIDLKKKRLFISKKKSKNLNIKYDKQSIILELNNIRARLLKKKTKVLNKNSYVLLGFDPNTGINYIK